MSLTLIKCLTIINVLRQLPHYVTRIGLQRKGITHANPTHLVFVAYNGVFMLIKTILRF